MAGGRYLYLVRRDERDWADPVAEPTYSWRLIGANNRPLGRSARDYDELADCVDVVRLIAGLDLVDCLRLMVDVDTGLWNWRLHLADEVLALSARSYQRKRECVYNAESFAAIAVTAAVALSPDDVALVHQPRASGRGSVPTQSRILERPVRQPGPG